MKYKKISLDLWRWQGAAYSGGTEEKFLRGLPFSHNLEPQGAVGMGIVNPGYPWALWVKDIYDPSTIAHEAFHIVAKVLDFKGLSLCEHSEESYAYTLDYIMDQVCDPKGWTTIKEKKK